MLLYHSQLSTLTNLIKALTPPLPSPIYCFGDLPFLFITQSRVVRLHCTATAKVQPALKMEHIKINSYTSHCAGETIETYLIQLG